LKDITIVWFLGIAAFAVGASNYAESLILPAVASEFEVDIHKAGLVITLYLVGFGFSTLFSGPLADRYGKVKVIIFSLSFFMVSLILSSTATNFTLFVVFRTLSGIFAAAVLPVSNALISDLFSYKKRQTALGLFQSLSFLGQSMCMIIGGALTNLLGWRSIFPLVSLISIVSIVLLNLIKKDILSIKGLKKGFINSYILVLLPKANRATYLVISAGGALIMGLSAYLGSFIKVTYNFDYLITGLILTNFGMIMLIFTVTGINTKLISWWGQKKMLLMGYVTGMLGNFLLLFGGENLWAIIVAIILLGLTFIFAHVTLLTMVSEFSSENRGAALSMVACTYMIGGGLGTAAGGYIIGKVGYQPLFLVHAVVYLMIIIFVSKFLQLPYTWKIFVDECVNENRNLFRK